jgi:hypothetical protein
VCWLRVFLGMETFKILEMTIADSQGKIICLMRFFLLKLVDFMSRFRTYFLVDEIEFLEIRHFAENLKSF